MDYSRFAIYTDLDGTLFNDVPQVSEGNLRAIRKFTEAGGVFSVCTGRTPANAWQYISQVPMNAPGIFFNGAAIYDYRSDTFLEVKTFSKNVIRPFLETVLKELPQVNIQVYTPREMIFVSPEKYLDHVFAELHKPYIFHTLDSAPDEWLKVLLSGSEDDIGKISEWAVTALTGHCDYVRTRSTYFELLPTGISKGAMLEKTRAFPEVKGRTLIGIGDYFNDLEFLKAADIAVAPANALAEVRQVADYVVKRNTEDAISDVILNVLGKL